MQSKSIDKCQHCNGIGKKFNGLFWFTCCVCGGKGTSEKGGKK